MAGAFLFPGFLELFAAIAGWGKATVKDSAWNQR